MGLRSLPGGMASRPAARRRRRPLGGTLPFGGGGPVRTFDFDAFDAFEARERPGEQILPWEIWERERPWREDAEPVVESEAPMPGLDEGPLCGPAAAG